MRDSRWPSAPRRSTSSCSRWRRNPNPYPNPNPNPNPYPNPKPKPKPKPKPNPNPSPNSSPSPDPDPDQVEENEARPKSALNLSPKSKEMAATARMVEAAADGLDTPEPSERHPSPNFEMHHVISDIEKATNDELMHIASSEAVDQELSSLEPPKTPSKSSAWQALRSKRKVSTLKLVF